LPTTEGPCRAHTGTMVSARRMPTEAPRDCPGQVPKGFWLLIALCGHSNAQDKADLRWRTRRALKRPGRARTECGRGGSMSPPSGSGSSYVEPRMWPPKPVMADEVPRLRRSKPPAIVRNRNPLLPGRDCCRTACTCRRRRLQASGGNPRRQWWRAADRCAEGGVAAAELYALRRRRRLVRRIAPAVRRLLPPHATDMLSAPACRN
jgi:hypothetical protein